MQQLILKQELSQSKIDALISFLKSWGVDAEVKSSIKSSKTIQTTEFNLNTSIWKDRDIDSKELRKQAWSRK
jgi:hypothetical protein